MGIFNKLADKLAAKLDVAPKAVSAASSAVPEKYKDVLALREVTEESVSRDGKRVNPPAIPMDVDPNARSFVEKVLERKFRQDRTNFGQYCLRYISSGNGSVVSAMEAGIVDDLHPAEAINLAAHVEHYRGDSWLIEKLTKSVEKKTYDYFVFNRQQSEELMSKYILRLSNKDNFEQLFQSLVFGMGSIITEDDIRILITAIGNADERIRSNRVIFTGPLDGGVAGISRRLSKEEASLYNLLETGLVDERKDEHDLVSWKELIRVIKGGDVEDLSPFAGAFNKYVFELRDLGVHGVVFKVVDKKLVSIKLSRKEYDQTICYGPVNAALALTDCFPNANISNSETYYVAVPGYVASPHVSVYSYIEQTPLNAKCFPAGETFLFNRLEGETASTRLYFYPYKPEFVNPIYQTMTVIHGHSDQMFHSCAIDTEHKTWTPELIENFYDWIRYYGGDNEQGVKAGWHFFMNKRLSPIFFAKADTPQYHWIGEEVSNSRFGHSKFTAYKVLKALGVSVDMYLMSPGREAEENEKSFAQFQTRPFVGSREAELVANYQPLTSRFVFYNYYQNQASGLVLKQVYTRLQNIPRYNFQDVMGKMFGDLEWLKGVNKVNELVAAGVDKLDAIRQVYPGQNPEEVKEAIFAKFEEKKNAAQEEEKKELIIKRQKVLCFYGIVRLGDEPDEEAA
jgi:hypothetical protein